MCTRPDIIAVDFYDGATEGFALSVKSYGSCYFKMIAWDDEQDDRLFILTEVDISSYDALVELLAKNKESSSAQVWVPAWQFTYNQDETDADEIVHSCRNKLFSSEILILGHSIDDPHSKIVHLEPQKVNELHQLLKNDEVDDLNKWLPTNVKQ